jgi:hypothetical protein
MWRARDLRQRYTAKGGAVEKVVSFEGVCNYDTTTTTTTTSNYTALPQPTTAAPFLSPPQILRIQQRCDQK